MLGEVVLRGAAAEDEAGDAEMLAALLECLPRRIEGAGCIRFFAVDDRRYFIRNPMYLGQFGLAIAID